MKKFLFAGCVLAVALSAYAATQVIDGQSIDAATWGTAASAAQDTNTQFGDNFNELNTMFLDSDTSNIYIGLTGNISDGFTAGNVMVLFLDTDAGTGSSTITTEPGGACPSFIPRAARYYNGATFDAGFTPDYVMTCAIGIFPGQSTQLIYSVDLTNINALTNVRAGLGTIGTGNGTLTGTSGIEMALNNTNINGVGGWFSPGGETPAQTGADPNTSTTGWEIKIPKSQLGISGSSTIRAFAFITNGANDDSGAFNGVCNRHTYASNQGLPGLGGAANLAQFNGGTITLNFAAIAGNQFAEKTLP